MRSALALAFVLLLLPASSSLADTPAVETQVRLVADGILRQTSRRLVDRGTGETFEDSTGLAPKPAISIESKFNAWFYQIWLLSDGMRRTAAVLDEPRYRDYGERNLEFIYRHLDFFQRQHDAKMTAAPVGDGKLSPIGFHFQIQALWHTGLAPLVLERSAATNDPKYEPFLGRMRRFLASAPRFEDGAFYRSGKGLMTDDPYMTVPFLVREWKRTGEAEQLDAAIAQVMGTHRLLFDTEHQLLRHLWDLKTRKPAGVFWGRGNGWTVLAHVELLANVPPTHPRRPEILAAFRQHMEGIRRCANPAGGWHQVLDHPESWLETSCTGMLTYGIARGINEGWLDGSFAETARSGWKALQSKVTPEGDLTDVCGSTDTGDLNYYLDRPRLQGDLHGFGSYLLAGAEMVRMQSAKPVDPR
jgi:unsaturated rhamnogalacturonyl hydrolase